MENDDRLLNKKMCLYLLLRSISPLILLLYLILLYYLLVSHALFLSCILFLIVNFWVDTYDGDHAARLPVSVVLFY